MATDVQTCYRHTDRRAGVRCQRCDRPICPSCMRQASVGFHCPECTKAGGQRTMRWQGRGALGAASNPVVTTGIVAINLALYLADVLRGGDAVRGYGQLGADLLLFGPAVAAGDWWRPITAGFVHSGLIHVGFNMFLLFQLGRLLEPAIGRIGFLTVYVTSVLGGSFAVLVLDPDTPTLGASGGVFGLMAAAFIALRSRGIDPFATGIGPLLVMNLALTFAISNISIGGHLGGLAGGALAGALLWEWGPRLPPKQARTIPTAVCALVAVALYAGCLLIA